MAQAYTPGLKVIPCVKVTKRRVLPIPGTVLVKKGDRVCAADIVARAELPGRVHAVNAANRLGVTPSDLKDCLNVKAGDSVVKGAIIARSKSFIKWFETSLESPVSGVVESVSDVTGQLLLREPPALLNLSAFIDGEVESVEEGIGVTVTAEASHIQGIFGVAGEVHGVLAVAADSPDEELLAEHLNESHCGKIVVGGSFAGINALIRAKQLGVAAVVIGGMRDRDLRELLGFDLGSAVTGLEQLGITIILTEGFGRIPMAEHTFRLLKSREGAMSSASGATQIRAGVLRPEIIIPGKPENYTCARTAAAGGVINTGDLVRIIREPHFGRIGTVAELPPELVKIPTESHVRIMRVRLESGEIITVPRANTELLEK